MSTKKRAKPLLADKIAELIAPNALLDPEIDLDDETAAKTIDFDVDEENGDAGPSFVSQMSDIRKKNVKLLHDIDAKYSGTVSSRKDFENDSEASEDEDGSESGDDDDEAMESFSMRLKPSLGDDDDEENSVSHDEDEAAADDDDIQQFSMRLNSSAKEIVGSKSESDADGSAEEWEDGEFDGESEDIDGEAEEVKEAGEWEDEEDTDDDDDDVEDDDESDFNGGDILPEPAKATTETAVNILPTQQTDTQQRKGVCVQNQLQIWEKLLEMRIHSQKMLIKANSLPNYAKFHKMVTDNDNLASLATETVSNVTHLWSKMDELQMALLRQNPETRKFGQKRKQSIASIESNDAKCSRIDDLLADGFEQFKSYRNSVITKWYDRTKVLTPGNVKSQQLHGNVDIMRKIDGALANRDDLVRKSQLHKGGYPLFDQPIAEPSQDTPENDESTPDAVYCAEIYDDSDFYHTQLRELIEYKSNTSTNANEVAQQFADLQKLRKKMKKSVDTRASKGRKIRYVVHNKLVSFMAPNDSSHWTNEAKNELYRSLFDAQV